jgi:hypothetical protein
MICELNTYIIPRIIFYNEKESVYEYDGFLNALKEARKKLLEE